MQHLTSDAFARASEFLLLHARPLEAALYRFQFAGGERDAVIEELKAFRNADGGFGHALEPDCRAQSSGALATTLALQVLRLVGAQGDEPLVREALAYLRATCNHHGWQNVPNEVDQVPHAPWWSGPQVPTGFTANPGAEVLGYFLHWGVVPPDGLEGAARAALAAPGDELEMHDLHCWIRLAELASGDLREAAVARVRRAIPHAVSLDPAAWGGYVLRPLAVAPLPDGPYADLVAPAIEADLDKTIAEQGEDGAWAPSWEWGLYPEAWPQARRDWQGWLTFHTLKTLVGYGRLR